MSYLDRNGGAIKTKYKDDLTFFKKDYEISDEMIKNFIEYAKSKDVDFEEENFKKIKIIFFQD